MMGVFQNLNVILIELTKKILSYQFQIKESKQWKQLDIIEQYKVLLLYLLLIQLLSCRIDNLIVIISQNIMKEWNTIQKLVLILYRNIELIKQNTRVIIAKQNQKICINLHTLYRQISCDI
ncbi:unnamed protein product [Paramecium primaurelia]|uniref:Uncharacterized protein n=1 Tax=Paramecium primaurelia TaxID=5886 RepID=A0A8S1QSB5_PARPR|nr:unnamed protein product [Paramecium primaurelia]